MLTTRISPKKQITIPSEIFRGLGLEIGDYLQAIIEGGKIVFSPQKMIPKDQAWFWTKQWQEMEKEAASDIRMGRVNGAFNSPKELIKSLKSRK